MSGRAWQLLELAAPASEEGRRRRAVYQDDALKGVAVTLTEHSSLPTSSSPNTSDSSRPSSASVRSRRAGGALTHPPEPAELCHRHWNECSSDAEDHQESDDGRPSPPPGDQKPRSSRTCRRRQLRMAGKNRRRAAARLATQAWLRGEATVPEAIIGAASAGPEEGADGAAVPAPPGPAPDPGRASQAAASGGASSSAATRPAAEPGRAGQEAAAGAASSSSAATRPAAEPRHASQAAAAGGASRATATASTGATLQPAREERQWFSL